MPISILIFLLIIILILIICSIVVNSINIPNYIIKEGGKMGKVYGGVYTELEEILTELRDMGDLNKEEIIKHLNTKFEELKDKYREKIKEYQERLEECNKNVLELHRKNTKQEELFKLEKQKMIELLGMSEDLGTKYDELEKEYNSILNKHNINEQTINEMIISYKKLQEEHSILESKMLKLMKGKNQYSAHLDKHTKRANRSSDNLSDYNSDSSSVSSSSVNNLIDLSDNAINKSKMLHMDNKESSAVNFNSIQAFGIKEPSSSKKPLKAKNPSIYGEESKNTGLLSFRPAPNISDLQLPYSSSSNENSPEHLQQIIDQLQNDKKELNEQKNLLEKHIENVEKQNYERIRRLRMENTKANQDLTYSFEKERDRHTKEIENLIEKKDEEYDRMLTEKNQKYVQEIENINKRHDDRIKQLQLKYNEQDDMNEIFLETHKQLYTGEIAKYKDELTQLKLEREKQIEELQLEHEEQIKKLQLEHKKKIEEYKNMIQEQEKRHNEQISNLELGHENAMRAHLEESENDINKAKKATNARIGKEIKQLQHTLGTIEDSQSKIMAMVHRNRIANNQKITNMNKMVNGMLAQLGNN